jgi:hypothetical protein
MARLRVRPGLARTAAGIAFAGIVTAATVARAQLSIHPGVGGGYTAAPSYTGESPGGDWNAEGFLLLGVRGVPLELRPSLFSYGRGTGGAVVYCSPNGHCGTTYGNASGPERATGGSLDAVVPLGSGIVVPYLIGGPAAVAVSRQASTASSSTLHSSGVGYELGAGARGGLGRMTIFGEVKFFGTNASADQFNGHGVHMVPFTLGVTL